MTNKSPPPEASASPASPQSPLQSPPAQQSSPSTAIGAPNPTGIFSASHWAPIELVAEDDSDSTYASEVASTDSMRSSIREYRILHGRSYHHDIGQADSWEPNDDQHAESMDMAHHLSLLILGDDKLHLAPLEEEKLKKVLDIGTGTGIWAMDFGDRHPGCEVIGTDVSPIQPTFVGPNVQYVIDDANAEFSWPSDTFDFIHARVLLGNIVDWRQFYKEAFRCCKPGGWMESHEPSFSWQSDLGIPENSALGQWEKVWWEGGKKFGRTFRVVDDDLQKKYMEEAGFVDIVVKDFKTPVGDWPLDPHQKRIGMWSKTTLMTDIEGYILYIWNAVMGWSREEVLVYIAHVKLQLRTKNLNPWFTRRLVYGRKPE